MVDALIRAPKNYESAFKRNRISMGSLSRSDTGLDGKEPFQAVIDKNLRSQRKRAQDNTREELTSVLQRVENVIIL